MKAFCEKQDNTYEWVEMGDPICGEDFCDSCGDCLHCYNEYCEGGCFWVMYKDKERNPFNKNA